LRRVVNLRIVKKRSSERKTEVEKGERVVGDDAKLAWFWVQGWRARLRVAGDLVEKCRYDF